MQPWNEGLPLPPPSHILAHPLITENQ